MAFGNSPRGKPIRTGSDGSTNMPMILARLHTPVQGGLNQKQRQGALPKYQTASL